MATNVLAPQGLLWSRNKVGAAPTVQIQQFKIKKGYSSSIGIGDLVSPGTSGNQGYVTLSAFNTSPYLGVFAGVAPYYDTVFSQTAHGLNGSYQSSSNPSSDIDCWVITDPNAVFRCQVNGGPFAQTWVMNNINIVTGTNGVPNAAGISTLALDGSSPATTATFPFRVEGVVGVTGGPNDPANTNPTIEVSFNFGLFLYQIALGV